MLINNDTRVYYVLLLDQDKVVNKMQNPTSL